MTALHRYNASMTDNKYTPEELLVREGQAASERAQALTLVAALVLTVALVAATLLGLRGNVTVTLTCVAVASPFFLAAWYFGWRKVISFRKAHRKAYEEGQEKIGQIPFLKANIFTYDEFGDKRSSKK